MTATGIIARLRFTGARMGNILGCLTRPCIYTQLSILLKQTQWIISKEIATGIETYPVGSVSWVDGTFYPTHLVFALIN